MNLLTVSHETCSTFAYSITLFIFFFYHTSFYLLQRSNNENVDICHLHRRIKFLSLGNDEKIFSNKFLDNVVNKIV